jgi:L,D-peptidoglycan transpeptidase YkuD (ErfK/YbiS/YcfS/YnhG family)
MRTVGAYSGSVLASLLAAATVAACPSNLANDLAVPAGAQQLITVEAKVARTTYASLRTWRRAKGCWLAVAGSHPARLGRNGLAASRREGDGTTPTGTFRIGRTMYGNEADPGVRFAYRRLRCGDWWNEDPRSPTYNSFQHVACGTKPPFVVNTPGMWQQPRAYPYLAIVEFNIHPLVPGRGSGIFLHAQTGRATSGCISLRRDELADVLRWLRPAEEPVIAIGTRAQLRG